MKRIKFLRTEQFESEGRNKGPIFVEGSVHEFDDAFADRWLRREAAIDVTNAEPDDGGRSVDEILDGMTVIELKGVIERLGITVDAKAKKADLIAAIIAHNERALRDEGDGLDDLDDDALKAKADEAGLTEAQMVDRATAIEALRAQAGDA